jgi:hypothetical protein
MLSYLYLMLKNQQKWNHLFLPIDLIDYEKRIIGKSSSFGLCLMWKGEEMCALLDLGKKYNSL